MWLLCGMQLYDKGALMHPACYGHMIITEHPLDSSCTHPSHFNFKLQHKPITDPHSNRLLHMLFRDKIARAVCETCTIAKPGTEPSNDLTNNCSRLDTTQPV